MSDLKKLNARLRITLMTHLAAGGGDHLKEGRVWFVVSSMLCVV